MIVLNQGDPPACLTVNSRARKSAVLKSALIDLQGFDTALKSRGRHARLDGGSRWAQRFWRCPLASHGGPLWKPLCYAQIGGLAVATLITLLLVPVVYSIAVPDLKIVKWTTKEVTIISR
jgi:hypothetical protein